MLISSLLALKYNFCGNIKNFLFPRYILRKECYSLLDDISTHLGEINKQISVDLH